MNTDNKHNFEHVRTVLDEHQEVAFQSEYGIVHHPDSEHGDEHPVVESVTLDAAECFACRQCFGYPGTADQLDAILGEDSPDRPEAQQSLAGWSA